MNNEPTPGSPPPIPPEPPMVPPPVPASQEAPGIDALKENAEKAFGVAKEGVLEGVAAYKTLDRPTQIYLGGLGVAVLFSLLFDVFTVQVKMANIPPGLDGLFPKNHGTVSAFGAGGNGKLAVLAAAAGIGIWVWNLKSVKKEPWVPMALSGCAGFSALMYLVLMFRSGGSDMPGVSVDIDMTLLGFWVPLAGAIAATVVAVKKLKATG